MNLKNYFPWVYRLAWIFEWFYKILLEQMGSRSSVMFPPMLWPGWDWAQMNAIYSSREAPWHFSRRLHDDEEYDYGDECVNDDEDDEDF